MAKRGSYPHPIIDAADDVASDFEVHNVLIDAGQQDIGITYEILCDDPDLDKLLRNGDAKHSLRWRCSSTISTGEMKPEVYRQTSTSYGLRAWLDQELVKGDVFADVRVIATRLIQGHTWVRQHPEYGSASFGLQVGDVLAEGGQISFSAEKLYDPLDPPIGSCFRFVRNTNNQKGIRVAFDSDETVDVRIPAKTFDDFKLFSNRPDLQISLVVLPALMETLRFMKANADSGDEPLDDKIWFQAINKLVGARSEWKHPILEIAQKLLDNPVDTAIHTGLNTDEED